MNRRRILSISAMTTLALALLPNNSIAQQKSLKEQLVGTWTLTSYETAPLNGAKRQIANPKGILMFDAGGRYSFFIVRGNRPKYKTASAPTTDEIASTIRDYVAGNFGTWSVNEADKTLTRHFDAALNPNNDRSETKVTVSLSGDELKLTTVTGAASGNKTDSVYRRAK